MAHVSPVPPDAHARGNPGYWCIALPAAVAFAYACGHLLWYINTPLGHIPVLDERENLALAENITHGLLPAEPFYRAPGYALALAGLRWIGLPANGLFSAALLIGVGLHALNTLLVARLARQWYGVGAAWVAGLLCALHPVFVHYATQALDATPGLTFFLLGLNFFAVAGDSPKAARHWAAASACWAAATLMRPNFFFVWLVLPAIAVFECLHGKMFRWRRTAAALTGALLLGGMALWQWQVSGVAGFLPWQGSYNLWVANKPGANGRYYVQQVNLQQPNIPAALAADNPARGESIWLYQRETGRSPTDIPAMNAYWRQHFINYIAGHPGPWLGLLARKTYALLNDWEQYNNKTFAFHKARSPWLRWNPLSWGVLFVFGVAGMARLGAERPRDAPKLALIAAAYAASVLLFFVSARFRLPLAALLCVLSGGALSEPAFWKTWSRPKKFALGGTVLLAAAITFSSFDHVRDHRTFMEDHALLAEAAATMGDDHTAWTEARAALRMWPSHPGALRIAVASYFNLLLAGNERPFDEPDWTQACRNFLAAPTGDAPDLRAVAALALWRSGEHETALGAWRQLGSTPDAMAARILVSDLIVAPADRKRFSTIIDEAWSHPLVRLAAARLDLNAPPGTLPEEPAAMATLAARLLDRKTHAPEIP
jgi:4-amino-4-deoxy-L-arabinose transferase-like glycosyltransferase